MLSSAECVVSAAFLLIGTVIFLLGFFPIKLPNPSISNINDSCFNLDPDCCQDFSSEWHTLKHQREDGCYLQPKFERVIFIVIDALRGDFVLPSLKTSASDGVEQMIYVRSLIEKNETVSYLASAHSPTVTLPRIKALMTGSVPGFIDVALNFNTAELKDDNLLLQLHSSGKQIVFYGDDTWIRLFPNQFLRSEGTTSFFVTDFTEVDENVTRHIDEELAQSDWDVLILHYLGLDHIGHLAGPRSPLVRPKLDEMDRIIKKLLDAAAVQDKVNRLPTLLVLCGDHGMSNQGSHGGSSASETNIPLIFMSSLYQNGRGLPYIGQKVQQIDLVPTLAMLLGLPIPHNSLGLVAVDSLGGSDVETQLKAAYINARQILKLVQGNAPYANRAIDEGVRQLEVAINMHRAVLSVGVKETTAGRYSKILAQYLSAITLIREQLVSSVTSFDYLSMIVGISTVWLVLGFVVVSSAEFHMVLRVSTGLNSLLFGVVGLIMAVSHLSVCTSSSPLSDSAMCSDNVAVQMVVTVFVAVLFGLLVHVFARILHVISLARLCTPKMSINTLGWIASILYVLCLSSSSCVEEEHQTWYFIVMTVVTVIAAYFSLKWSMSSSSSYEKVISHAVGCSKDTNIYSVQVVGDGAVSGHCQALFYTVGLAVVFRIMRSWNQTGDKWSHLPDVGDWLNRPENQVYLSLMTVLGLALISLLTWLQVRHIFTLIIFTLSALFVYFHHAANKSVLLPFVNDTKNVSKGITEARCCYMLILVAVTTTVYQFKQQSRLIRCDVKKNGNGNTDVVINQHDFVVLLWQRLKVVWSMLILLLVRPHNIFMVMLMTLHQALLHVALTRLNDQRLISPIAVTHIFMWMGQAGFFIQGNSNSLASIDIAAGYVGLDGYNPVVICVLLFVNTFGMTTYWILALHCHLASMYRRRDSKEYWTAVLQSCYTVVTVKALVMAFYTVLCIVQRYHLFVWTVFSPKLLYEAASTLVMMITSSGCLAVAAVVS